MQSYYLIKNNMLTYHLLYRVKTFPAHNIYFYGGLHEIHQITVGSNGIAVNRLLRPRLR